MLRFFKYTPRLARSSIEMTHRAFLHTSPCLQSSSMFVPSIQYPRSTCLKSSVPTNDILQFTLSDHEKTRLGQELLRVSGPYLDTSSHLLQSYRTMISCLPDSVIQAIHSMRREPNSKGILLIRNLPLDPFLPETPRDGRRVQGKSSFVSEACLTGVAQIMGDIYSYATEKDGELIHNIVPVKTGEMSMSNESSKIDLGLHVENVYFGFRPHYIALYCLRPDHEGTAYTYISDVRRALSTLTMEEISMLQRPVFITPSPVSHHKAQGGVRWSAPRPLIVGPADTPELILHLPFMKVIDSSVQSTFDKLCKALTDPSIINGVCLQPGDLILINNRKVAHGRTYFKALYDGKDRWLQRVYISLDTWPARSYQSNKTNVYNINTGDE